MREEQYYVDLAEKWLNGSITEEEKKEFSEWYHSQQDAPLSIPASFAKSEQELKTRMLSKILAKKNGGSKVISLRSGPLYKLTAACLFLIISGLAIFFIVRPFRAKDQALIAQHQNTAHVLKLKPSGNKAMLTLADGSQIILDTAGQGLIAQQQNSRIIKSENDQLVYHSLTDPNAPIVYNTLNTPNGGQYTIVLADGTKVWLNSASSLHFPTNFVGKERVVELSGEGYFEVAKNAAMPFKVKVNDMEVRVLGTHFNIMAYGDEAETSTTLLEGSVHVQQNNEQVTILPGEQAKLNKEGKIKVLQRVNTEQVLAWKNGTFQFEETDIQSIMRQIARWYDLKIVYVQNVTGHFSGTIARNESVEKVLHMLELTGTVHFTKEDKTILVRH